MEQHDLGHETTPAIDKLREDIKGHCLERSGAIEERLDRIEKNHLHTIPEIKDDASSAKFRSGLAFALLLPILAFVLTVCAAVIVKVLME